MSHAVLRHRATSARDKASRHRDILDALERLYLRKGARVPSVAEVADESGVAKGTVYLYFGSKEEMLLALHARRAEALFDALAAALEAPAVTLADVLALVRERMVDDPQYLPLASRCLGAMAGAVAPEVARAFRTRLARRLEDVGALLVRRLGSADGGDGAEPLSAARGAAVLRASFALLLGLWQIALSRSGASAQEDLPPSTVLPPGDVDHALASLWHGMLGPGTPPAGGRAAR